MVHCKRAQRRPREPDGVPAVAARAPVPAYMTPTSSSVAREAVFGGSTPGAARATSSSAQKIKGLRGSPSPPQLHRSSTTTAPDLPLPLPAVPANMAAPDHPLPLPAAPANMAAPDLPLPLPLPAAPANMAAPDLPLPLPAAPANMAAPDLPLPLPAVPANMAAPDLPLPLPLPAAPANMADAADATPLLPGLPNDIAIWEILIRLPPKPLLRCRAVSPAWHHATTTRDFLLCHHARQPALPLLYTTNILTDGGPYLDIVHLDHRAGAGVAAADRFQSVARLKSVPRRNGYVSRLHLCASCDGLLVFSSDLGVICICNPATQEYASLNQLLDFRPVQMYPHPTIGGEYQLLLYREWGQDKGSIYVFTIGSGQPPRKIGCPDPTALRDCRQLLFQGSIYWYIGNGILVFDTTDESFRKIRIPFLYGYARLFEMGDMLAILSVSREAFEAFDIWVLQDYQAEVWDFKCRVELPVAETRCQCPFHQEKVMVVPVDNELLLLLNCDDWLFQVDVDGKLIATFHSRGNNSTHYLLKQTLVQHKFFPTLEGYVVKASEDYVV